MTEQTESLTLTNKTQTGITITLGLSILLASLGTSIVNIALPTLAEVFLLPFIQVQAVVIGYLISLTITVVIAGRLGDRYGCKSMLIVGLVIFSLASLLCSVAPSLWILVAARSFQGIGAAFLMTLAMALTRQTVSKSQLGRAMGMLGTISALGTALGPVLGGLLITLSGWQSIFGLQFILASIAIILAWVLLPNDCIRKQIPTLSSWQPDQNITPNLLINLMVAAVMMATLVIGPFYLSLGLSLNQMQVGLIMGIGPVVAILSGIPSGRLVDRWGSRYIVAIGLIFLIIGSFMLAIVPKLMGLSGYIFPIIILTLGYQLFQAANNTMTLADVPKARQGMVSGLLSLSRNMGLIIGASVMGAIFSFGVGTIQFNQATALAIIDGMQFTFLCAGALMIVGLLISCVSFRRRY
ncbi:MULTISPECIES: MFS transporter [Acinetobacter]|uniref:MFS transporter n=1 Tax=Acinetobacter TaxID=469 RepID=UPI00141ABEA2|nr:MULTISPECIES: MFS transporter [Acinetobacter]MCS4300512.1 MFS family permease [Acinetobacter guillouiae]MCW2253824.1 MFS family permease [Acinetobacter sp. BIGb0204]NII36622.1 MFS family permease [Acinetobacter sp. BIGb0196]